MRTHRSVVAATLCLPMLASCTPSGSEPFDIVEATIPEMHQAMEEGRVTSRELVDAHLLRIALYEEDVNAVISVNHRAREIADSLDALRAEGRVLGPLHGIPIALKDNIHTTEMPTTGGALAFQGYTPPYRATLTENLHAAGAIVIAKTVMTELANLMARGMPGNYSAVGGYGLNPYDPRRDPRADFDDGRPVMNVGGSSSGIGTAMSFWTANVGTETRGSIVSPSNANMLVGIKPTVGRVSRWGVIPITADQDTPGPMARTVTDAAILLGALEGSSPDPNDPATSRCERPPGGDYTAFLDPEGLRGARIGIPRAFYHDSIQAPGSDEWQGGIPDEPRAVMREVIEILADLGAVIVDPADIPSLVDLDPEKNFLLWQSNVSATLREPWTYRYGMTRDFNAWLGSLGESAPVATLTKLREWNLAHRDAGSMKHEQARLDAVDETDLDADRAAYDAEREQVHYLTAEHGIDEIVNDLGLDALLFPGNSSAHMSPLSGYPTVVVPFARVMEEYDPPLPDNFEPRPRPFGVGFTGVACSEPRLIEVAYAFEQATRRRVPPPDFP